MPLTVREAIHAARTHLQELMPEIASVKPDEIRLEEIERCGDLDWAITFSLPGSRVTGTSTLGGFPTTPFGFDRIAKVVIVDGSDGKFASLKQRAA
ncbi:MAG: hypothetical protein ACP5E2_01745 [Terracidiphilus sp.]